MTIDDVNKEFAIIAVGNKMAVMENNPDGSIKELWSYDEFKRKLIKEFIKVKTAERIKTMHLADYWLSSHKGREYNRLVYDLPGSYIKAGPKDYNGWLGFSTQPKNGDWTLNRSHILNVICSGNEEYYAWVMNWLASLIQLPGRHAWTSLVIRGGQGIGKGFFANNQIGALFCSQQYLHIIGSNQLTAEFNEHLSGKAYVFADESTWGGDPRAAAKLKGLVTEGTIPIHRKFLKMVEELSMLHIVIASNNEWPIPIDHDDRRFTVLDADEMRRQDLPYFESLSKELKDGGLSAMLFDLLDYPVNEKMLRTPLVTDAKSDVTSHSLKNIEHWWLELLESGNIEGNNWPDVMSKNDLHRNYIEFLDRHHKTSKERRSTETEMGMFLKKFTPVIQQISVNGKRERVVQIPMLAECRERWLKAFNWPENYPWDRHSEVIEHGDAWEAPLPSKVNDPGF